MSIYLAHGVSIEEIKKYLSIDECSFLSVAEYITLEGKADMKAFQHEHDEYEFIIPLRTIPLLYYDKAVYIGEVGYCYPVNPYVSHGIDFDLVNSHVISITVEKNIVDRLRLENGFDGKYFYTRFCVGNYLLNLIKQFQIISRRAYQRKEEAEYLAYQIVSYIVQNGLSLGVDARRPEKQYAPKIKKIALYMYEHFTEKELTIELLAKLSGYSFSHFSKAFKAFMNDTPIMHLNKLRLSEAKRLFYDKELTLSEISSRCGYYNLSTFSQNFKNIIGMLPKDYRKKYY